jgi:hypothetical protein
MDKQEAMTEGLQLIERSNICLKCYFRGKNMGSRS